MNKQMNKRIISFSLLLGIFMLFINTEVFSQISCETNQDIPNFLSNHSSHPHQTSQNNTEPLMNGQYCFNVYFHFIRRSDGTGGQPSNTIHQMITILNDAYNRYGISFSLLGYSDINSDWLYEHKNLRFNKHFKDENNDGKFDDIDNFNFPSHENAIDIYLFPESMKGYGDNYGAMVSANIPSTAFAIGGKYYNLNLELVYASVSPYLIHEMGHALGLYHTYHGTSDIEPAGCPELVNGSNSLTCGDYVEDTPADPIDNDQLVNPTTCLWNGLKYKLVGNSYVSYVPTDQTGATYNPDMTLIMSRTRSECMQKHTDGQILRIKRTISLSDILQKAFCSSDIIVRDNEGDTGIEPNPQYQPWQSQDIWLTDIQGNPINLFNMYGNGFNRTCLVNVRVKNIGALATDMDNRLHLYWSKSTTNSRWMASWTGNNVFANYFGVPSGGRITPEEGFNIGKLQPGEERIIPIIWNIPDDAPFMDNIMKMFSDRWHMRIDWGFALLAKINDGNYIENENSVLTSSTIFAQKSNNVAIDNGSFLKIFGSEYFKLLHVDPLMLQEMAIEFKQIAKNEHILSDFAEVYAVLSHDLMRKLDIANSTEIKVMDENAILLTPKSVLRFYPLEDENAAYFIGVQVNFISDKLPEFNNFDFDLNVYENETLIDKHPFTAIRNPEVYFKAEAEASKTKVVKAKASVTLTSNTIADEAKYIWYNEAGEEIGEGWQITVTPEFSQNYTVMILKNLDGYKSYDEVKVLVVDGLIENLSPNPATSQVIVDYKLSDNATNCELQLSNIQNMVIGTYQVSADMTSKTISLGGVPAGNYFVKLLIGGVVVDSKTLLIK